MKPRVLGSCYVCGKHLYGTRPRSPELAGSSRKGAVKDGNGLRHASCRPAGPGFGSGDVAISDA